MATGGSCSGEGRNLRPRRPDKTLNNIDLMYGSTDDDEVPYTSRRNDLQSISSTPIKTRSRSGEGRKLRSRQPKKTLNDTELMYGSTDDDEGPNRNTSRRNDFQSISSTPIGTRSRLSRGRPMKQSRKRPSSDESSTSMGEVTLSPQSPPNPKLKKSDVSSRNVESFTPMEKSERNSLTTRIRLQKSVERDSLSHENYFLAGNKLKFRSTKQLNKDAVMNDAKKGKNGLVKKPRKGQRGLGGNKICTLPEKKDPNFSVTKEASDLGMEYIHVNSAKHEQNILSLIHDFTGDFPEWILYLKEGFNIMIHGYGSKLPIFEAFKTYLDEEWLVISVPGLCPKLNPRKFLVELCKEVGVNKRLCGSSIETFASEAYKMLMDLDPPRIFLLIQNFDYIAMNNSGLLCVLCTLARIPWIHMVASSDHINSFLGVNQGQIIDLNFVWKPCSTFQPYEEEIKWIAGDYVGTAQGAGTKTTLQYVLKSLTGNARKAFHLLARLQLEKMQGSRVKKSKEVIGVEFRELARHCKEKFIAHSDTAVNTLLVEFVDHKLITHTGKSKAVGNLLTIDLDKGIIEDFVANGCI